MLSRNMWLVLLDSLLVGAGYWIAYSLRFGFEVPREYLTVFETTVLWVVVLKLVLFSLFRLYKVIWRYIGMIDLYNVVKANGTCTICLIVGALLLRLPWRDSAAVLLVDGVLALVFIAGVRVLIRLTSERSGKRDLSPPHETAHLRRKRAVIVGAGEAGEKIFREIRDNAKVRYEVIGFLDDDPKKTGLQIHALPVLGSLDALDTILQRESLDEVIVATKAVSGAGMRKIVEICRRYRIEPRTIPVLGDILNGQVMINRTRPVKYEDLLGRQPVKMDTERIGRYVQGKNILVTGGAGSIGSELCRQAASFGPKGLVICDNCENSLYDIDIELGQTFAGVNVVVVPVLADIRDPRKMDTLFARLTPDVVFHAAAYKHVPMMEAHAWEAVENNVVGTLNVLRSADRTAVDRFVLVSSDKAVRPSSVMGATKRVTELLTLAFSAEKRRSVIVRFGNVAGSEGSVIPLFRRQIEWGGPVTVTHPEITRYFMTIPEAAQLILEAAGMGEGGEIFVLDMGTPVKIVEIARDLIRFSGLEPDEDIKILFTGLRSGEKLTEELVGDGEGVRATAHEKISAIVAETCDRARLLREVEGLVECAGRCDGEGVRSWLRQIVSDYRPHENGGAPS
jgi:FlaA1/EpsC-like NDP-sugar epimerase